MAGSWAELLKGLQEQQRGEASLSSDAVWKAFKRQASRSNKSQVKRLAEIGEGMTPDDRARFAIAVVPLLVTLDWPVAWEKARKGLVLALDGLVNAMGRDAPDGFLSIYETKFNPSEITREDAHAMMNLSLFQMMEAFASSAATFALISLRKPCPPSELPTTAYLCNMASVNIRQILEKTGDLKLSDREATARSVLIEAFERYGRAARAMNDAVGKVLFEHLDFQHR